MPTFIVRIETSVSVEAKTAEEAAEQATQWAQESLSDSNAQGRVYRGSDKACKNPIHTFEP